MQKELLITSETSVNDRNNKGEIPVALDEEWDDGVAIVLRAHGEKSNFKLIDINTDLKKSKSKIGLWTIDKILWPCCLTICIMVIFSSGVSVFCMEDGKNDKDACESSHTRNCYNRDIYFYDSCGNPEYLAKACGQNGTCSNGKCIPTCGKTFGGFQVEITYSIQQTNDGGYIVAGDTESYGSGSDDFWVLKIDASGNKTWALPYGGIDYESAKSIQQTNDGGYIVTGETESSSGIWALKLDDDGGVAWQKRYGNFGEGDGSSIKQTTDGGYIVAGNINFVSNTYSPGIIVLKINDNGDLIWEKTYGEIKGGQANDIQQTTDGGYIVTGTTPGSKSELLVLKLDESGNTQWYKEFKGDDYDIGSSIQQTSDGGYIAAGQTYSYKEKGPDVWVLKLDASGNKTWDTTFEGKFHGGASSIEKTSDGGYIVAGYTFPSPARGFDFLTLKLDSSGNQLWTKTFGGTYDDKAESIQQTMDGGYIVAGETLSFDKGYDFWVIKLDANGECEW